MHKVTALIDLDGTLCDHDAALERDMAAIRSPGEEALDWYSDNSPPHIQARKRLIRSQPNWWLDLEPLPLGFKIYEQVIAAGYSPHILTKGPWSAPTAWSEKYMWCRKHLGPDVPVTITSAKDIVYGAVLVDDYPDYIIPWLEWRPRGLVIMPVNVRSENFRHPQVVRCDGTNMDEVIERLRKRMEQVIRLQGTSAAE